jgi:hypothetical protein
VKNYNRLLLGLIVGVLLPVMVQADDSLAIILSEKLRLSPEQVEAVLAKPIPEHAQREIGYGFVDEEFVRFMMGVVLVRDKIRILNLHNLKQLNPWLNMYSRYRCTSVGLQEIHRYPMGSLSNDCFYLWPEFLSTGPALPFEIDFPLVELLEPWSKPSVGSLDNHKKYAQEFVYEYKIPDYMHDDLLSLRIDGGNLLDIFRETAKHPREEFKEEMTRIETQPPVARRFGRLICARDFKEFDRISTPWDRTCYAYWHRYMDMKGDGDQVSEAYRNNTEPDPRQRDFRPLPPTRAEAELGELRMHALMWKIMDREMCESKSAACSNTLKEVMEECRKKHEALRQAFLDDPNGDNNLERFTDSVHECALADKRLAPYLPAES